MPPLHHRAHKTRDRELFSLEDESMRGSAAMADGMLRRRRDISEGGFAVETLCRALRVAPPAALWHISRGFYVAYMLKTGNWRMRR